MKGENETQKLNWNKSIIEVLPPESKEFGSQSGPAAQSQYSLLRLDAPFLEKQKTEESLSSIHAWP